MFISQIINHLKLTPIKSSHDIEIKSIIPSKFNHHKLFKNDQHFIKLRQISSPELLHTYSKPQDWFLDPICIYANNTYCLIVTPLISPSFNNDMMPDTCLSMLNNDIFYLDWKDTTNFAVIDGKLKVIDIDITLSTPTTYEKATPIIEFLTEKKIEASNYSGWKRSSVKVFESMR